MPQQVTYGFAAGVCSGFALVKAGKVMAGGLGVVFLLLQGLAYSGFIIVDQEQMRTRFEHAFDVNGDGEVNEKDANEIAGKVIGVLEYNLPAGSGFVPGLLLGMHKG